MSTTYHELFQLIDADGGGTLSLEEVQQFVEKLGLASAPSPNVIARLFVQADADRSNAIDQDEFTALCEGIKLVIGLSEKQMVDAYASHEIKRLFSYLCSNHGSTMRRDDLRKAVDVLNHALRLDLPDTVLTAILRDTPEVDFEGFRGLLTKLCPDKPLTSVASAFLLEERRRREHLNRVKSMYEQRRSGRGGKGSGPTESDDEPAQDKKICTACVLKDQHIETLGQRMASLLEENRLLQTKVNDIGDVAIREVQLHHTIQKLQNQVTQEQERVVAEESLAVALRATIADLNQKLLECEGQIREQAQLCLDRDQLISDFALLEKEHATTQQEVQTLQERLQRKQAEVNDHVAQIERLKAKLAEREEHIADLERRESEVHVKEIESLRMQRLMAEMRERCERRERELDALERSCAEDRFKMLEREKEIEAREDAATALDRQARRYEVECHEKWENVFRKAQVAMESAQERLNVRELEVTNKEAELTVREQIFEANQRKAEATSLPERERRLKMLQSIEEQLSQRERQLRAPERKFVYSIAHPELLSLREENQHLQSQVVKLRVDLDAQQQKLREETERFRAERISWMEKSKLSLEMQNLSGASPPPGAGTFAAARSRRQSILGGASPNLSAT